MHYTRYNREKTYRSTFFKTHSGFFHKYYFCAYCGRLLSRDQVTVDHWIPVGKAKKTFSAKFLMYLNGIFTINDSKNLIASCSRCNAAKSDKMRGWLFRGWIGKSYFLWILRKLIRLFVVLLGIYLVLTLLLQSIGISIFPFTFEVFAEFWKT